MISLILPYWDRQEAANKALNRLEDNYFNLKKDLEVIIVDDGNSIPFVMPENLLNACVIRMPRKTEPKSCISAWNEGVRQARGDVIVLSCIEILHEEPILNDMLIQLEDLGSNGYVLAAAWCPEGNEWHCHSSKPVPDCPPGSGISFCGMLYKELFNRAGGFDEDYREGAGYEDRDFILRLHKAGARFCIRDDLVVIHPKTGASINWGKEKFDRNLALYQSKWPKQAKKPVTFVCLKAGNYFGPEYVNILYDMVKRNLPFGYPGKFVCITDDPTGIDSDIEILPLPGNLEKWWGKLYMFKRGLFPDGDRIIFLDLDTVIVGGLQEIVKYDGQFATLQDFYFHNRIGPAVIMWEAGEYASSIWSEWFSTGMPRNELGDLWWLNNLDQGKFAAQSDKLQKLFPGSFVSFKAHCKPFAPKGTKVVCFHGYPRPHECDVEWVKRAWAVGGLSPTELEIIANTGCKFIDDNVIYSSSLNIPWLDLHPAHDRHAVIVGGAPSLNDTLDEIKYRANEGQDIFATNNCYKFLCAHSVNPYAHIIIDSRERNIEFVDSQNGRSFLASQCHPSVFKKSFNLGITLFHMNTEGILHSIPESNKPLHLISSGSTVGLAAMAVAYCLGYRTMHLYGMDSCYSKDMEHHAYRQPMNDGDIPMDVECDGRKFKCAPWMVDQAQKFQELAVQLVNDGVTITVAGDGLLQHIARSLGESFSENLEVA